MPRTLKTFNDQDELRVVRLDHLNPLIDYTKSTLTPKVDANEVLAKQGYREIRFDEATKSIFFKDGYDAETQVNLTNIIPDEFRGIGVLDDDGASFNEITSIKIEDATVTKSADPTSKEAVVQLKWQEKVREFQERPKIQKGSDAPVELKNIKFDGNLANVTIVGDDATITVPKNPVDITATVGTSIDSVTIEKIEITGNTGGTTVSGSTLQIVMPDIPSPQAFTQWFVGFYDTLGELISDAGSGNITPVNDKSFAFVKDKTVVTGQFYDAYMYINDNWTEAPVDPAITYEQPGVAGKQGVFSIKPSTKISIDAKGQLDLDKLGEDEYFVGYFETLDDLNKAEPNPVVNKTTAFIRLGTTEMWTDVRWAINPDTKTPAWENFSHQAAIGAVASIQAGLPIFTKPIYGILEDSSVEISKEGILSVKGGGNVLIDAEIYDHAGNKNGGKFDKIKYVNGMSYAVVDSSTNTLTLEHPQRVITYSDNFEANHNQQNYKGNIFYDDASSCWMGWATPSAPGAVGKKWTRIAHEGMSDQVKRLDKYLPQFTPEVTPGALGDEQQWFHTGWSYVDSAADLGFTDNKYVGVGVNLFTFARPGDNPRPGERPRNRTQIGYIEDDKGQVVEAHFRMQNPTASGSEDFWGAWTKFSFTPKELKAHEDSPTAHKNSIKFHKVISFTGKCKTLAEQKADGDATGGLVKGYNCGLLQDNYGHTTEADKIEVPYAGKFRVKGELALSGFANTTNYINGKWVIMLRLKKKGETGFKTIAQYSYSHTGTTKPYPALKFTRDDVEFGPDDELIINITFSETQKLTQQHPEAFFVPLRSHFVIEDMGTQAGTLISQTYRQYMTDVERTGDVGVKIHYPNMGTSGSIRVYGESLNRIPTAMSKDV